MLLLAACAAGIHSSLWAQDSTNYNKKELQQLIQQAKTVSDYQKLAAYFVSKENIYLVKAKTAQENYEQARRHIAIPKYPAAADTAKWFYQYDRSQADQMAKLAGQYEQKLQALGSTLNINASSESTR